MSKKWVYVFGKNGTDGNASMKALLGGKGANLAEIASLGLPVPPGFTISTDACTDFYTNNASINSEIKSQAQAALESLCSQLALTFGDPANPLLVSVRSGARASMPGMMDTILNVGLNDKTVEGLAKSTNNEWFAYDSYRRLIEMFSDVVLEISKHEFDSILNRTKESHYVSDERELPVEALKVMIAEYKNLVQSKGKEFPQDVNEQLWMAIGAVFRSWMNDRAIKYRKIHNVPENWGTAVNIQSMVFGNFGDDSATGVCFTRDPSTGDNRFYGEFLINAQGEDVVAGTRTPQQITIEGKTRNFLDAPALEEVMPEVYQDLYNATQTLEQHFKDMQDIEFTVQNRKLWLLQTRNGKRSARASIKLAVDMVAEGMISKEEAVLRVSPHDIENLLHPMIDPSVKNYTVISKGLPASPGAATGIVCFNSADAEVKYKGQKVILVRSETSPEDIGGMHSSQGILTSRGGMTSHAAVVARGMGKPCIVGATDVAIDEDARTMTSGGKTIREGEKITINGSTGEIILGEMKTIAPTLSNELLTILTWSDEFRKLGVRTNADTPEDSKAAREFGAEGIGLCRTEHMFFNPSRILSVRKMIIASDDEVRNKAIAELFEHQKSDFKEIFTAMKGLPVTIRLLDPPLHEFLPTHDAEIQELSSALGASESKVRSEIAGLRELNPMLGHRGCRLAISHPEIYEMQVRAILEAAIDVDLGVCPEIMIPLVQNQEELEYSKNLVTKIVEEVKAKYGKTPQYTLGTMIELPRAALRAKELGAMVEFFSFGTNDLTQTTLGLSRDDAGKFLQYYLDKKIFANDPFSSIDQEGVGELVRMACDRGRSSNPKIKLGICGEHGGDPESIEFFAKVGLHYVSCSPFRVPVARLAAAHAALKESVDQDAFGKKTA